MGDREAAIGLAKKYLVDCIYSSVRVEGLNVTFPQTQEIIQNAELAGVKATDVLFVINMRDAWRFVLETLDEPVNSMYVRQLNSICGHSLIYGCGVERSSDVYITGTTYKPPIPQHGDVVRSLQVLREEKDPLQRAILTFAYLAKTQIFIDGNKRVAQLAANQILISSGVGVLRIPDTSVQTFSECLIDYYETGGSSLLNYLQEECLIRAQVIETLQYRGINFTVQEIVAALPKALRDSYTSDKECAEANVGMYYEILCKQG